MVCSHEDDDAGEEELLPVSSLAACAASVAPFPISEPVSGCWGASNRSVGGRSIGVMAAAASAVVTFDVFASGTVVAALEVAAILRDACERGREFGVLPAGLLRMRLAAAALSLRARVCITPDDLRAAVGRLFLGALGVVLPVLDSGPET